MNFLYVFLIIIIVSCDKTTSTESGTDTDGIETLRQLAVAITNLLRSNRQNENNEDCNQITVMKEKIKTLENKLKDYEDDRNHWTTYASAIIELQSRMTDLERDKDSIQTSLLELKKTDDDHTTKIHGNTQQIQIQNAELQSNFTKYEQKLETVTDVTNNLIAQNISALKADVNVLKEEHQELSMIKQKLNTSTQSLHTLRNDYEDDRNNWATYASGIIGLQSRLSDLERDKDSIQNSLLELKKVDDDQITKSHWNTQQIQIQGAELKSNFTKYEQKLEIVTNVTNSLKADVSVLKEEHQELSVIKQNLDTSTQSLNTLRNDVNGLQQKQQELSVIKQNLDTSTQSLNTLRNDVNALQQKQQELSVIKQRLHSSGQKFRTLANDVSALRQKQQELSVIKQSLDTSSQSIDTLRTDVNALQRKHNYTMVTFSGRLSSVKVIANVPMKFSYKTVSKGGGYNTTDGKFYPPYRGWYLFDVTVRAYNRKYADAYLVKNNNDIIWISSGYTPSKSYPSSSRSVTLYLEQTDRVWVRARGGHYSDLTSLSITLLRV